MILFSPSRLPRSSVIGILGELARCCHFDQDSYHLLDQVVGVGGGLPAWFFPAAQNAGKILSIPGDFG
jgi:hypothetical protein